MATYIWFAHPRSATLWPKIAASIPGLEEGDTILVRPEPHRPVKLSPMRFFLLAATQYWAKVNDQGQILAASMTEPTEEKREWKEHIESIILAFAPTPDGGMDLVPCSMSWRTTKCGACHRAIDALKMAGRPEEWGTLTADHKFTLQIPIVWARFVATVRVQAKRASKSSGYQYAPATSLIHPTTAAEVTLLNDKWSSEDFQKSYLDIDGRYKARLEEVKTKCQ